jgi:hypothetical protein
VSASLRTVVAALAASFTACSLGFGENFSGGPDPSAADAAASDVRDGAGEPSTDATPDGGSSPPDPDLVGWWKLDEGSGTAANDSTGYGNHGELKLGAAWLNAGKYGSAIAFDGVSGSISVTRHPSINPSFRASVAFFVRIEDDAQDNPRLFAFGYGFSLKLNQRRPQISVKGVYAQGSTPIAPNAWHHVAVTFDFGQVAIYYDGYALPLDSNIPSGTLLENDLAPVKVGCDANDAYHFKGGLDDVRLYRRVLAASEVAALAK